MEMIYLDTLSIIIAAFIFMVVAGFWYSNLMFKKIYHQELNIKEEDMAAGWKKWLGTVLVAFVVSYILALLQALLGVVSILEGLYVGLGIFIGFVLPPNLMPLMWAKKPCKVFFIESGFWLLVLLILSGFLGA